MQMFYVTQDPLGSLETGDKLFGYQFFRSYCTAVLPFTNKQAGLSQSWHHTLTVFTSFAEFWDGSPEISVCRTILVRIPQAFIEYNR